jgi:hypothetical protein
MKLILTAVEESLAEAWTKFCGDLDFVTVHHGSIFDVECDAVVSPANSYGFFSRLLHEYRTNVGAGGCRCLMLAKHLKVVN